MSDHHPINDVKTTDQLESHTYRAMVQTIGCFQSEQLARFGHEKRADVFLAIHQGAFNAVVASMCRSVGLPVQTAAQIAVTQFESLGLEIQKQAE